MTSCADCGFKGRLYRPAGEFLRDERIKCLKCLSHLEMHKCGRDVKYLVPEWHVPARVSGLDEDGKIYCWSHTWGPDSSVQEWLDKKDNIPELLKYKSL